MAGLFDTPRWDKNPQPVGLELSRTHRDIHHALEDSALFQTGLQAVPQSRKQVSLQGVGPVAPTGPALVGSPETMRLIGSGSNDPLREKMIDTLQTPGRGWQIGPQGSLMGEPAKPQLTPASIEKPALVGGIPQGSPKIQVGSEDVRVGGFVISPQGTIETQIPPLSGLAPSATLEAPRLQTGSLATGQPIEDTTKITKPTFKPTGFEIPSIAPSLIPPIMIPSAIVPTIEQASLGAVPQVVAEIPLPPAMEAEREAPDFTGDEGE